MEGIICISMLCEKQYSGFAWSDFITQHLNNIITTQFTFFSCELKKKKAVFTFQFALVFLAGALISKLCLLVSMCLHSVCTGIQVEKSRCANE